MKKVFLFLLCIFILTSSFCYAEESQFEFRNNIHFYDDIESVIENENIKSAPDQRYKNDYIAYENVTLSGISGAWLYYNFEDGKLNDIGINYKFYAIAKYDEVEAEYKKIQDGLIRKYGDPLDSDELHEIVGSAIKQTKIEYNNGHSRIYYAAQWVVPYDDYSVKIDHILWLDAEGGQYYYHLLSYRAFSQDNLDKRQVVKEEIQKYIDDLVDNDL